MLENLMEYVLVLFIIVVINPYVYCEKIHSVSYEIISQAVYHDLQNIFDDDLDTSSDVHIETNRSFAMAIKLQQQCLVNSISIFTEFGNNTLHEVEVGFKDGNGISSLKYVCEPFDGGVICRFPCTVGNKSISFFGKYVFWTMRQMEKSAWTRINEVSIQGACAKYESSNYSNVDVVLQKPFSIQPILTNTEKFCQTNYWELFDNSVTDHIYEESNNLTVYFGQNFIPKQLSIVLHSKNKKDFDFYFGSVNEQLVTINLNRDCNQEGYMKSFNRYTCGLSSLENRPFDQVKFAPESIRKLNVFGIPVYYPTLKLSTKVVSGKGDTSEYELTCTTVSCAEPCQPPGEVAECQGLVLFRKQIDGDQKEIVIRSRHVEPRWANTLNNLEAHVDDEFKTVIRIPKTHAYVGQYQCGCESTDSSKTLILSNPTTFKKTDFLSEAIFQRHYQAEYGEVGQDLHDGSSGLIELVTEGKGGFFLMTAKGITLSSNLFTNVEWTENGLRMHKRDQYLQEDVVRLYPDVEALANWTILANRVVPLDLYPDARDNETVVYQWGLPDNRPDSFITDVFHIVDVDKTPFQPVRAWMVSKSGSLLHILAYYQHSDSRGFIDEGEVRLDLLSSGCEGDAASNLVATFEISGKEVKVNSIPDQSKIDVLTYGLGLNIFLKDYSTFHRYNLQAVVQGNRTTLLDVRPSVEVHPKDVLEDAKFDVAMMKYATTTTPDDIRVEILVESLSPALLNYLKCSTGSLKVKPAWNAEDERETSLQVEPSSFDFMAPKSLISLDFQIDFTIDGETKSIKKSFANPYLEEIEINFNSTTGALSWDLVSSELGRGIKEYEVVVLVEDIGCGTTTNLTLNNLAPFTCTRTGSCTTQLWAVEQLHSKMDMLMNYTIMIIPRYYSFDTDQPSFGKSSFHRFTHGVQGHSVIQFEAENAFPRTLVFSLQPFRKTPCENIEVKNMDATFELTAYAILAQGKVEMALEGVEYKKLSTSNYGVGGTYEVTNLQPGREYKIKGFLKYPGHLSDLESIEMTFTTPDEILLPEKLIYKNLGESLLLNCSAAVGTDPKFQKDLRWLRSNSDIMPNGASSVTAANPDASGFLTASLSIPYIDYSHAGAYCCAPEPPVEHFYGKPPRCAEFLLVVKDLQLDHYELEANQGMTVSVTCSTKLPGNLEWIGPDGRIFARTDHTTEQIKTEGVQSLRLLLSDVNAESVGVYQCLFQSTEHKGQARQTFTLRLKDSLIIQQPVPPLKYQRFGDIATLTCLSQESGTDALRLQWYRYLSTDLAHHVVTTADGLLEVSEATNSSNEVTLHVRLTPASRGRYMCVAIPEKLSYLTNNKQLTHTTLLQYGLQYASTDIQYHHDVEMLIPTKIDNGSTMLLHCTGYPAFADERLVWAFRESAPNAVYVFGEHDQDPLAIADKRIAHIMSCFRLNGTKPVASRLDPSSHNPLPSNHELYQTDKLDIVVLTKFTQDPVCQAAVGQLVCRYQRLNSSSSTSSNLRFPMLLELGTHRDELWSSNQFVEMRIALEGIRAVLSEDHLQESSSRKAAEPNGSLSIGSHQLLICILVLILLRTLCYVG